MSGKFFSKFDSEYFSFFIFLKYLLLLLLIMIYVPKMTLLEKSKICRTFRAVGHLGTLHTTNNRRQNFPLGNKHYAIFPRSLIPPFNFEQSIVLKVCKRFYKTSANRIDGFVSIIQGQAYTIERKQLCRVYFMPP